MYNDENNQYNPRPRFDPKTGERIHYDDENTTETTQAESSEYRYSAGNIPFEQENNNTSSRILPISRQAQDRAV